jgi:hypothetical protein
VKLDLLDDLVHSVDILLPNGTALTQSVIYETLPRFCKQCKVLGHATGVCSKTIVESRKRGRHEVKQMGSAKHGMAMSLTVWDLLQTSV